MSNTGQGILTNTSAEQDMQNYDRLPAPLRKHLQECILDTDSAQVYNLYDDFGLYQTLEAMEENEEYVRDNSPIIQYLQQQKRLSYRRRLP